MKAPLKTRTVEELRLTAKELNISGRSKMTKSQLIEAINGATVEPRTNVETKNGLPVQGWEEPQKRPEKLKVETFRELNGAAYAIKSVPNEIKQMHIEKAMQGDEVAFINTVELVSVVLSGVLVSRNTTLQQVKIVNKHGKEFTVKYFNVLWVKEPGKLWPRAIYNLIIGRPI